MIKINSITELDEFILNNQNKIIMLYFGALWCGPCKKLKEKLNNEINMPKLVYCYIDVDIETNLEISKIYNISVLPTTIFVKLDNLSVKIIDRIDGYDYTKLLFIYNSQNV